jgi:hypothetical protein
MVVARRRLRPLRRHTALGGWFARCARVAAGGAVHVLRRAPPLAADATVLGVPLRHPGLL